MTGYMFRNAQYRLELQQSLEQVALPEPEEIKVSSFCLLSTQLAFSSPWVRMSVLVGELKFWGEKGFSYNFSSERALVGRFAYSFHLDSGNGE